LTLLAESKICKRMRASGRAMKIFLKLRVKGLMNEA
jgi:hypothetical protein